jgi:translation initiation factor 4G
VGKTLEKAETQKVNDVFVALKEMTTHEGLNFRFRFMLQDVIDLRREKWVGRIETLKAKKLSDVHKQDEEDKKRKERQERARERQAEDARRASAPSNRKSGDRYTNLRSPQKAASTQSSPDDGFMTQTQKKGKRTGKPETRPVSKPSAREETRVSKTKVKKSETEEVKKPAQPSGFGVLEVEPDNSDDAGEIEEIEQPEELDDGGEALENEQSEDSEKSREEALKSIERLLYDFLRSQDMKEAIDCIEELKTTQYHSDMVDRGVNLLFDANKDGAALLVNLFRQLATDGIVTRKHLEVGLAPSLEILDDLIIDFPLALSQLAAFVAPLVVDSVLPLSIFTSEAASTLKGSGSLGKWFDLTLKTIQSLGKDPESIKKLVQDSKLDFAGLFKSPELLQTFLAEHQELKALAA